MRTKLSGEKARLAIFAWLPVVGAFYHGGMLPFLLCMIILGGFYEIEKRKSKSIRWSILSKIHILGLIWFLNMTRDEIWLVTVTITFSDAAGLIGGKYFNFWKWSQIKIFPVSPNKTLGGFIYGLFFGTIAGSCVIYIFKLPSSWVYAVLVICLVGVLGDLFASKFKRLNNLKDSGEGLITEKLLYGHGGVYDRFDALAMACHFWGSYLLIVNSFM